MNIESNRMALITRFAEQVPDLGRTALMKYCYFLQTLRHVPLGYSFTLYSYGPFDSDVLSDLDAAEAINAVKTEVEYYSGGYGYRIEPAIGADNAKRRAADFLTRHERDINWVITQFRHLSAAQLELASTIVYSDREASLKAEDLTLKLLAKRVQDIKPHFPIEQILAMTNDLDGRAVLKSIKRI
jgi:uncharacterized protein